MSQASSKSAMFAAHKSSYVRINKTLIVCLVEREPFVIYDDAANYQSIDSYTGVAVDILRHLMEILDFSVRVTKPPDDQFGTQLSNGSWTGLVSELINSRADIGLTALSITNARAHVIEFTRAYYVDTSAILLPIPDEVENLFAIFAPLSVGAWLLLLSTVVVLIVLVALMSRMEQDLHSPKVAARGRKQRKSDCNESEMIETETHRCGAIFSLRQFYYSVNCVLAILLMRDIKEPPRESAPRLLVCVWWLSTIVIVNIYQGILFGLLVIPQRPASISTIDELVEQSALSWGVTAGSALFDLFEKSPKNSVYGRVGERMLRIPSVDAGIKRVMNGRNFAYLREKSILTFKVAEEHKALGACRLMFAREEFFSVGFGIGLQKKSPFAASFDAALGTLIENGFVARSIARHFPQQNEFTNCKPQPLKEGEPLSMKHFASIFVVCLFFYLTAAFVLVYQNIESRFFRRAKFVFFAKRAKVAPN